MDSQIKKMQNMWQKQKSNSSNANELIRRLNQIEKKVRLRRTCLIILLVLLIIASAIFVSEILTSVYFTLSYVLLFAAILIKLIHLYRIKYRIISNESDFNNHNFIKKLKNQQNFKTNYLLIYLFLAILSLNFVLLGSFYEKGTIFDFSITDENRIFYHLSTIVLFVVGYLRHKKIMATIKKETLSLIKDLENNN